VTKDQRPACNRYRILVDGAFVCWIDAESAAAAKTGYLESVAYYRPDVTLDPNRVEAQ
jgi:hypothetical protein